MSTRSSIAIQNTDGTFSGIYCHCDGYLSHNGRILEAFYTTEAEVRELINLGDLSVLGETVGVKIGFGDLSHRDTNQCMAYGRDRGETGTQAADFNSYAELLRDIGQEYDYLYVPGKGWYVGCGDTELAVALDALEADTAA